MENSKSVGRLRIYVSSTDQFRQTPLYEFITLQAKKEGLAGATVTKGVLGYGASSVIHSYKFWEVSDKVPTVIEIVDNEDKVLSFYEHIKPQLESMKYGCLATFEKTTVLLYKSGQKPSADQ
jgi:PII-like signaling protein